MLSMMLRRRSTSDICHEGTMRLGHRPATVVIRPVPSNVKIVLRRPRFGERLVVSIVAVIAIGVIAEQVFLSGPQPETFSTPLGPISVQSSTLGTYIQQPSHGISFLAPSGYHLTKIPVPCCINVWLHSSIEDSDVLVYGENSGLATLGDFNSGFTRLERSGDQIEVIAESSLPSRIGTLLTVGYFERDGNSKYTYFKLEVEFRYKKDYVIESNSLSAHDACEATAVVLSSWGLPTSNISTPGRSADTCLLSQSPPIEHRSAVV
jgi:hypothetical protein